MTEPPNNTPIAKTAKNRTTILGKYGTECEKGQRTKERLFQGGCLLLIWNSRPPCLGGSCVSAGVDSRSCGGSYVAEAISTPHAGQNQPRLNGPG